MTDRDTLDSTLAGLDELVAGHQEQLARMMEVQGRLQEISCTATSPRREVSVTALYGGGVGAIDFTSSAYKRMAPAELSTLVLTTLRAAQEQVVAAAVALVSPTVPDGIDAAALVRGELDPADLVLTSTEEG